jgi:hypothetical protein
MVFFQPFFLLFVLPNRAQDKVTGLPKLIEPGIVADR